MLRLGIWRPKMATIRISILPIATRPGLWFQSRPVVSGGAK
jgi:hypothetical protein